MKKYILFLCLGISISVRSQNFIQEHATFIGKSFFDIRVLNAKSGNPVFYNLSNSASEKDGVITREYKDARDSISYMFNFVNDTCVSFIVYTEDRSLRDVIQKEIEKKSCEKISHERWLQRIDNKDYIWYFLGTDNVFVYSSVRRK